MALFMPLLDGYTVWPLSPDVLSNILKFEYQQCIVTHLTDAT